LVLQKQRRIENTVPLQRTAVIGTRGAMRPADQQQITAVVIAPLAKAPGRVDACRAQIASFNFLNAMISGDSSRPIEVNRRGTLAALAPQRITPASRPRT
jgi:hypothetical protein